MGMAPQTATGTGTPASVATPPATMHPVRQASMAPPPAQRIKPQPSHQLSVSSAANSTPPKVRPQSGNLLQSPESSFGARPMPRQQLSVKDSPAPGLPHQSSTASDSQPPQGASENTENAQSDTPAKSAPQSNQQHLLKPTNNKQVHIWLYYYKTVCETPPLNLSHRKQACSFWARWAANLYPISKIQRF